MDVSGWVVLVGCLDLLGFFKHLLENKLGLSVFFGQAFQVIPQMVADSLFCSRNESQAPLVTNGPCGSAQSEGKSVPGGI